MSALRIARPGEPVQLIDQGPATGRVTFSRGPVNGTIMVAAHENPGRRRNGPRCENPRCGRMANHTGSHQTEAKMAERSARKVRR